MLFAGYFVIKIMPYDLEVKKAQGENREGCEEDEKNGDLP